MGDTQLTVYPPQEKETLEEYFKRYTDAELQIILSDSTISVEFWDVLLNTYKDDLSEPRDGLHRLWGQNNHLNNYEFLQHCGQRLQSVRRNLLKSLEETANHIEQYTKYGSILRLISSASDIAGTVGGLWMRNSTFDYSNPAFKASTAFGFIGAISTIAELYLSKNDFDDVMKQLKEDQKLFTPIQLWFQQTEMLQQVMLDVFPPAISQDVIRSIVATAGTQFRGVHLLAKFFKIVIEKDIEQIRNEEYVKDMLTLFSRSDIVDLFEWMIFQQSPIFWDISKMMLQLQYSPLKFIFCQHLPALSPKDQELWSTPVWGRIALNFVTMLDALRTLRRSEISTLATEMRQLHRVLKQQLAALDRIIQYIESRRN